MSMVNILLAELKIDVSDDIKAARSAASITPLRPVQDWLEKGIEGMGTDGRVVKASDW